MNSGKLPEEMILQSLGVEAGDFIFEVVVSTCDAKGNPNAAPMGIRFVRSDDEVGMKRILIKPFKSTTTYNNLSSHNEAVINVTSDPEVFYKTAFKIETLQKDEFEAMFYASKTVKPPRIRGCDAYIEVSVTSIKDAGGDENRSEVLCDLKLIEVKNSTAKLYCRAPYVLVEAIIHATRVKEFTSQGLIVETIELKKLIERYRRLINRVASTSRYSTIANEIVKIIRD